MIFRFAGFALFAAASAGAAVPVASLIAAATSLPARVASANGAKVEVTADGWKVSGRTPFTVVLAPEKDSAWDVSKFNYARLDVQHEATNGVFTVEARLDNPGANDWSASCPGSATLLAGATVTVGFPFNRAESDYHGPEIFKGQLARPDGHRLHWRSFDPANVRSLRLTVRSSSDKATISIARPAAAWPADAKRGAALEALPYLDAFGQARALDWPGKVHSIEELQTELKRELESARAVKRAAVFNRFGGWADGPQLTATGNFRTEKNDGRWWLVDPDGKLFFSTGVTGAGFNSPTLLTKAREQTGFFAWLPPTNDPLAELGISPTKQGRNINFPAMNLARAFGTNWNDTARDLVHSQVRALGLNTLAAWSDDDLMRDARTPYTLTTGIWWPVWNNHGERMPSPFAKDFESALRKELEKYAWAKDDPFCLGVFVDNELAWPDEFTPKVFAMPDWEPTRKWVLEKLRAKYADVPALNTAWGTKLADWDDFNNLSPTNFPAPARADIEPLYADYARAYFVNTRRAINEVLPGKLYLGCRTHRGPKLVGRAAAGAVDVFSVNCYDARAAAHQIETGADQPVLVGEFHFGALDRGVPSPGLRGVHDQQQRGLAYASYLASALADPRFVGVHWFQWLDHPASGRPDAENHACGVADVTGRVHPEFGRIVSQATRAMYPARAAASHLKILEALVAP